MPPQILPAGQRMHRLALLLVSLIPIAIAFRYFDDGHRSSSFGLSQLLYGGELGFHRRFLLGWPLRHVDFVSQALLENIGRAMSITSVLVVYARFARPLFGVFEERVLFACLLSGAGMLPHLAYLTGFPDLILAILTIGAISLLTRPSAAGILLGVTPLVVAALCIHEAYIVQLYPSLAVIGAGLAIARPHLRRPLAIHLLIVLGCLAYLVCFGRLNADGDAYLSIAQSRTDLALARDAFIPLTFDLRQQWQYLSGLYSPAFGAALVLTIVTSLPYFVLLGWIHLWVARQLAVPSRRALCELGVLATPIALVILGHDWMRWFSFAAMNVTLVIGYRYLCHGAAFRANLGEIVGTIYFQVGFLWTLVITPFGQIAGNRLTGKVAELLGQAGR